MNDVNTARTNVKYEYMLSEGFMGRFIGTRTSRPWSANNEITAVSTVRR